jgi:biotin carboxyl carrier protein
LSLFRDRAIREYLDPDQRGGLVTVAPPAGGVAFGVIAAVFLTGAGAALLGEVQVTASGRGVVRPEGGVVDVRAPSAGTVEEVPVRPGERLGGDSLVARLRDTRGGISRDEIRAVAREQAALDSMKATRASTAGAEPTAVALFLDREIGTQEQRLEDAKERLRDVERGLEVRSPAAGVVDALRVRPGQHVMAGEQIARVVPAGGLVGLLSIPARHRPHLEVGREVRLDLDELPVAEHGFATGRVRRVSADLVDGDAEEPAFLVEIELVKMPPGATGEFRNGMGFTGKVVLRSRRIASLLFPYAS